MRYRICRAVTPAMRRSLAARVLLVVGGAVGLGVPLSSGWGTAAGIGLLVGGAVVTAGWFRRARTVLEVASTFVGIGRWRLDWAVVLRVVVYDLGRESILLGVQVRSADELPAGVPVSQLDQSAPELPIILSGVDSARVDLGRLVTVFRQLDPRGVDMCCVGAGG